MTTQSCSISTSPSMHMTPLEMPSEKYGTMKGIGSDRNYICTFFGNKTSLRYTPDQRTVRFLDVINNTVEQLTYSVPNVGIPCVQAAKEACFFTDVFGPDYDNGVLGVITRSTAHLVNSSYKYAANLSVCERTGITSGIVGIGAAKTSNFIVWDLNNLQPISSRTLPFQNRTQCAMIPSEFPTLAVTVQSGNDPINDEIALWDLRMQEGQPVQKHSVKKTEKDIVKIAVVETSQGPRLVTSSTSRNLLDFRALFDGQASCSFGEIERSVPLAHSEGFMGHCSVRELTAKGSKLTVTRKIESYSAMKGLNPLSLAILSGSFLSTSTKSIAGSYDCWNLEEGMKPDVEIGAITRNYHENTFTRAPGMFAFEGVSERDNKKHLFVFKTEE